MIFFAVSPNGYDHEIFKYRSRHGNVVLDSTAPIANHVMIGYQLADYDAGNWWSILIDNGIILSRCVSSDYHWGSGDGILLTNFAPAISKKFNPLIQKVYINKVGNLTWQTYKIRSGPTLDLDTAIGIIGARLATNLHCLTELHQCSAAAWSQGLDTMCNHWLRADLNLVCTPDARGWTPAHKAIQRYQRHKPLNQPWIRPDDFAKIWHAPQRIIDGFYGDTALARNSALGAWAAKDQDMDINAHDIYHLIEDSYPAGPTSWIDCKQALCKNFLYLPCHGIGPDYTVYDSYRDIRLLETVLRLGHKDLCQQMNTAVIQKKILAGSGFIGYRHKNLDNDLTCY